MSKASGALLAGIAVRESQQRVLLEARGGGPMINVMVLVIVLAAGMASVSGLHRIGRGAASE
jgi:hypothetical protein